MHFTKTSWCSWSWGGRYNAAKLDFWVKNQESEYVSLYICTGYTYAKNAVGWYSRSTLYTWMKRAQWTPASCGVSKHWQELCVRNPRLTASQSSASFSLDGAQFCACWDSALAVSTIMKRHWQSRQLEIMERYCHGHSWLTLSVWQRIVSCPRYWYFVAGCDFTFCPGFVMAA